MVTRVQRMDKILKDSFGPDAQIHIQDDSAKHAGHAGLKIMGKAADNGETHFTVTIVSSRFNGMMPVARHRMVNDLLKAEFDTGLHALTLKLSSENK